MEEMELYHIHKSNKYDKKWEVNKELLINEKFNSGMNERYNSFSTSVECVDYDGINLELNHNLLKDALFMLQNNNRLSKEQLEELKLILNYSYNASYYGNMFKRETALENYRKDNCIHLPSRLHSIYLTDEEGKKYWEYVLSQNSEYSIYKVLVNGNIFKTNEELIPNELLDYQNTYNNAIKYWNPKFKNVADYKNEYLVQGKVRIIEKIR